MADIIDKNSVNQDNANPRYQLLKQMTSEERQRLREHILEQEKARGGGFAGGLGRGLSAASNFFLQRGGLKPIETETTAKGTDLNTYLQKEMIKQKMKELHPDPFKEAQLKALEMVTGETGGTEFRPKGISVAGQTFERVPTEAEEKEKLGKEMERKKMLKLAEAEASMRPALNILTTLESNWEKAFPKAPKKGLGRFAYGIEKSLEAFAETDPDVSSYLKTREAFLSLLVRGLGEKGVLTNIDINRVRKAIPDQFTTKQTAKRNFETIEGILSSAVNEYLQKGGSIEDVANAMAIPGQAIPMSTEPDTDSEYRRYLDSIGG